MKYLFSEKTAFAVIIVGVSIIIIMIGFFLWHDINFTINSAIRKDSFGQFGDIIGGVVGSIWALAGIILFYVALKDQRSDFKTNSHALGEQIKALNVQTREFELQREELKQSRKIFEEQSKTLKKQQFESTFFSLLKIYSEIVISLQSKNSIDYFAEKKESLFLRFKIQKGHIENHKFAIEQYTLFYIENKEILSHYFKSLYRVMKFVDDSYQSEEDKYFYSKIVRSQLKEDEAFILFYNANTLFGNNFQFLILKYNLLKHLPSMSKLESKIAKIDNPRTNVNRILFLDWFTKFLIEFVGLIKTSKYDLVDDENDINRSENYPQLNSIFEFTTADTNKLTMIVHTTDEISVLLSSHLGLNIEKYITFQEFLLVDLLQFSQFKIKNFSLTSTQVYNSIKFQIESESGFDINLDNY